MKKTTREIMDLQETLSHDLLKNEILMLIIDLNKAALLRSNESTNARAEPLADDLWNGKVKHENVQHAATAWQKHEMPVKINEFLAAVAEWDIFEPKKEFNSNADKVRSMVPSITELFKNLLLPNRGESSRTQVITFFVSLLTVYDFIRALDEQDPQFDRYLKPL